VKREGAIAFGEIAVDFDRMELRRSGQLIPASVLEFRLLKFFVDNPEYVFSRSDLIRAVWPERKRVNNRSVDNIISRLRRKIEDDPARPAYFRTFYGAGYKFLPSGLRRKRL